MFNFFSELKEKCENLKDKISPYQIVMVGDFLFYLEGDLTLMTLTKENIVIKVKNGVIIITGENLSIKDLTSNTITILGKICMWERV